MGHFLGFEAHVLRDLDAALTFDRQDIIGLDMRRAAAGLDLQVVIALRDLFGPVVQNLERVVATVPPAIADLGTGVDLTVRLKSRSAVMSKRSAK